MAKNSADMNLTGEKQLAISNLIDMFTESIHISTIREIIKKNNFDLDSSLMALLKFSEAIGSNDGDFKNVKKKNQGSFASSKGSSPSSNPSSYSTPRTSDSQFSKVNRSDEKGFKKKKKWETPQGRVISNAVQPQETLKQGFSGFYQGAPLVYQPPNISVPVEQVPQQVPAHLGNAQETYYVKNPRFAQPYPQRGPVPFSNSSCTNQPPSFSNRNNMNEQASWQPRNQAPKSKESKDTEMLKTYDKVIQTVHNGHRIMVLMRGCPGSGKTYAARQLIHQLFGEKEDYNKYIFSADDYFTSENNVYNFNPELLAHAHHSTQAKVLNALRLSITPVIIDNTNTQIWEMQKYASMVVAWGYYLEVLEPLTSWKFDPKTLVRKSIHHVPLFKVRDMLDRYEHGVTGQKLFELNHLRYPPNSTPPQPASNQTRKQPQSSFPLKNNTYSHEHPMNKNMAQIMHSFFQNHPPSSFSSQSNNQTKNFETPNLHMPQSQYNPSNVSKKKPDREFTSNKNLSSGIRPFNISDFQNQKNCSKAKTEKNRSQNKLNKKTVHSAKISENSHPPHESNNVEPKKKEMQNSLVGGAKKKRSRKRKSLPSVKTLNFSKDYIVIIGGRPVYQRDYSLYFKNMPVSKYEAKDITDVESASCKDSGDKCETLTETENLEPQKANSKSIIEHFEKKVSSLVAYDFSDTDSSDEENSSDSGNPVDEEIEEVLETSPSNGNLPIKERSTDFQTLSMNDNAGCPYSFLNSKPPRNLFRPTVSSEDFKSDVVDPSTNDVDWNPAADLQSAMNSWKTNFEKCIEEGQTASPSLPQRESNSNRATSKIDAATITEYDQVLSMLQSNPTDCKILDCENRNINEHTKIISKMVVQQKLHLNKSTMTDDYVPIVKSTNSIKFELDKVFPSNFSSSLIDLIDVCQGDINTVISSLIDNGYEISEEQFEVLASLPKNCISLSESNNIEVPVKESSKSHKVATTLPKLKVKQPPSLHALKLKEELESKFTLNLDSYPEHVQALKRMREQQQQAQTTPLEPSTSASEESVELVIDNSLVAQLQQCFGSVLPLSQDFSPVIQIPSSLAFQLHGIIIEALEQQVNQQEDIMQQIINSDRELAKELQNSENNQFRKTELEDLMDMKLALQLYEADLKSVKAEGSKETVASVLSKRLLFEMFPSIDKDALVSIFKANNSSFHNTVRVIKNEKLENWEILFPETSIQEKHMNSSPESCSLEPNNANSEDDWSIEDFKEALSYHHQMRMRCFNQAREAFNSGKSQVAAYFSQLAFLHKEKMEKASFQVIHLEMKNNLAETLDLHFFAVKEALLALDIYLDNHIKSLRSQNKAQKQLFLITGRGTHSSGGVPKVKPAVLRRLSQRSVLSTSVRYNPGLVNAIVSKNSILSSELSE